MGGVERISRALIRVLLRRWPVRSVRARRSSSAASSPALLVFGQKSAVHAAFAASRCGAALPRVSSSTAVGDQLARCKRRVCSSASACYTMGTMVSRSPISTACPFGDPVPPFDLACRAHPVTRAACTDPAWAVSTPARLLCTFYVRLGQDRRSLFLSAAQAVGASGLHTSRFSYPASARAASDGWPGSTLRYWWCGWRLRSLQPARSASPSWPSTTRALGIGGQRLVRRWSCSPSAPAAMAWACRVPGANLPRQAAQVQGGRSYQLGLGSPLPQ